MMRRVTLTAARAIRVIRAGPALSWLGSFAVGIVSLAVAGTRPIGAFGGASATAGAFELAAGWALIAAGLYVSSRGRAHGGTGWLLAAAGVAWFLSGWNNPGVRSPVVFSIGLVGYLLAPPILAHAVLRYASNQPFRRTERTVVSIAYLGAVLVLGLLPALFFDPVAQACSLCPTNLLLVHSEQGWTSGINRFGVGLGLVWAGGLVTVVIWRLARSSSPLRRVTGPVLLPAAAYFAFVATDFAHSARRGLLSNDGFEDRLWLAEAITLCAIGVGIGWSWVLRRRTRSAIAGLVVQMGQSVQTGGLRQLLVGALGDQDVNLAYPLSDGSHVDADGMEVDVPPRDGRVATPLARSGETVAVLLHRRGLLDDPALVEEVISVARLALENEHLEAEIRAQAENVRASRTRIVITGDAERQRIERDLHDGAQQRLIGLLFALRFARAAQTSRPVDPDVLSQIERAEREVQQSIDDLRELARGIYPAILADEGLTAALGTYVLGCVLPVEVAAVPEQRFPSQVEAVTYFLIAQATGPIARLIGATTATVRIVHDSERLLVEVIEDVLRGDRDRQTDDELHTRLTDLADRVGALGGNLLAEPAAANRFEIRAEIPCAWS
jgi:signal transduction histidine kinase